MKNIEQLIEAVKETGLVSNTIAKESLSFEELQLEALFEIKDVLVETQKGLFEYFDLETQRYEEQQLAEIERLRELQDTLQAPVKPEASTDTDGDGGNRRTQEDSSGLGLLGAIGGFTVLKSLFRFIPRLLPFLGLFAVGGIGVSLLKNLREANERGSNTVGMDVAGDVAGDIYDFAALPVLSAGLNAMAKEVGYNEEELRKSQEALKGFKTNIELAGEDIFRDLKRFLGEELAQESAAESEERIGELRTELREVRQEIIDRGLDASPGGEIETGMSRLEAIKAEREQISNLPFTKNTAELRDRQQRIQALGDEQREIEDRLEPVFEEQRIQSLINEEQRRNFIAQQGFEMEPVTSQAQINFAQMTSEEKVKYVKDNMEPQLKSAVESGAVKRLSLLPIVDDMFRSMAPGAQGIPVELGDIDSLSNLSVDQLEALRINDDILRNSALQTGALTTSDRNVLEAIYRSKVQPSQDAVTAGDVTPQTEGTVPTAGDVTPPPPPATTPPQVEPQTPMSQLYQDMEKSVKDSGVLDNLKAELDAIDFSRSFDVGMSNQIFQNIGMASVAQADAVASTPINVVTSRSGDVVNTNVMNSTTNVIPNGVSATSSDPAYIRHEERMYA